MYTPIAPSILQTRDGRELRWEGFFTGPRVLDDDEVAGYAHRLLGATLPVVTTLATAELSCFRASAGPAPPALLLHSATPTIKCFEGDLEDLAAGRSPHDVATYMEARSVYLGTPADLAVGRTQPWRDMTRLRGVPAVDVGKLEYYYLSQALLAAAEEHHQGAGTPLGAIVAWIGKHPDAVIRLYALDTETQIFLLWLRRETGLPRLWIDANHPVVAARWNHKSHLHPTVTRAAEVVADGLSVDELLVAEQHESEAFTRLRIEIPVLPGYTIPRAGVSRAEFVAGVLEAANLLRHRYGISSAALKPSEAGDGARIVGDIDLDTADRLAALAEEAYPHGDDYLLEAWVEFLRFTAGELRQPVVPSGHFRHGWVAEGLTLQTLDGYSWTGNVFADEAAWAGLGLPTVIYRTIRQAMESIRGAFVSPYSVQEGCYGGLVTGGVDFAVGRVGGRFADRTLVGAMDFNLSSHGAEYMRALRDEVRAVGAVEQYVATRVFRPSHSATLEQVTAVAQSVAGPAGLARVVTCVPGRWAMVGVTGADPSGAMRNVRHLVSVLAEHGLATHQRG